MCNFICNVPEKYLDERKIQIEYIKKYCPNIASIPWQKYYPCNLYNYTNFNNPQYLLKRSLRKAKQIINQYVNKANPIIERNCELQFLGEENQKQLLQSMEEIKIIPKAIVRKYIDKFLIEPVKYSHSISMLLTLAVFSKKYYKE